ncbi:unnamed protein product [Candidula unifasciata]|uniref:HAUS augmin-like complex subunit 7 n=1 Tax=Candidula unifasciata TaxID=100452 RepID=A0A8S3Z9J2_9EUPU|nr:unnamed protein product [Candidula unifasciata]
MVFCLGSLELILSLYLMVKFLEYPETEDMDEAYVVELLLSPGEGRLKILEWLFSRYDEKLEELLSVSHLSFGTRTESRLQKLLTAACAMCLCQSDDVGLIKGEGSLSRQVTFIDRLLDMVCTREKYSSSDSSIRQDNTYIDTLVSQDGFMSMFDSKVDLLPRDIRAEVENMWIKEGWIRDRSPQQPNLQDLVKKSEKLACELSDNNLALEKLQKQVKLPENGKEDELLNLTHKLATVLKELHQLADGFMHCFENQVRKFCHQTPPELSDLGLMFKRVHVCLEKFVKLLENLDRVRQVQSKLNDTVRKESDVKSQVLVQTSRNVLDTFQHCVAVLEETLHRSKTSAPLKYTPVLTL